jgi:hypothetical protein
MFFRVKQKVRKALEVAAREGAASAKTERAQ